MTTKAIIESLLKSRGLTDTKAVDSFFHPLHPRDTPSPFDTKSAIALLSSHISSNNPIFIYGDYDVDGICATALLWETIYNKYTNVHPFIPHRQEEGYGLSKLGIDKCLSKGAKLIITVDNGIVAHDEVAYCRSQGCDLLIIDHHEPLATLPEASGILYSKETCATGLVWFFCRDFSSPSLPDLSLVALACVCDLVPLLGLNRSFVKFGLSQMRTTTRPGLQAIFKESNIDTLSLDAYHLGFIVGPRINAMGRLDHALDSLRLLCTRNPDQAAALANLLGDTNKERQLQTDTALSHALSQLSSDGIIVVADASYHPGIIGLIAGKLTEKYYRPAVAISVGKEQSKASARSIPGFHITDELRKHSHLFVNIGGHAQAAGFTIDTSKIGELIEVIKTMIIPTNLLIRPSRIDCQIPISSANQELYLAIQDFAPFGLGNPTPVFESLNVSISSPKRIGSSQQHLKFKAGGLDAIYFNAPSDLALTSQASLIYSLTQNTFNGSTTLQLNIKSANL